MENQVAEHILINQNPGGYRYSLEPFLLAHWAQPVGGSKILDIGTGCGIIALLLMSRQADLEITAIEIQKSLYQSAVGNVDANGWSQNIRVLEGNYQNIARSLKPESFDWILSNPPYRKVNSGKINPCREKALARHELAMTLETLAATSAPLLKPGGKIGLAYPYPRLEEVMSQLRKVQLSPTRLVRVIGHEGTTPKICLVEAIKGKAIQAPAEQTLTIFHPNGSYTKTMQEIYASFDNPERSHCFR